MMKFLDEKCGGEMCKFPLNDSEKLTGRKFWDALSYSEHW